MAFGWVSDLVMDGDCEILHLIWIVDNVVLVIFVGVVGCDSCYCYWWRLYISVWESDQTRMIIFLVEDADRLNPFVQPKGDFQACWISLQSTRTRPLLPRFVLVNSINFH